ncbi:MAG: hypothetical protein SO170_03775 [Butyribacter sp.]|nr:hypothetical protein [bacterium]MDY3854073.1 hypothetical protein [Butyribacter sp.]
MTNLAMKRMQRVDTKRTQEQQIYTCDKVIYGCFGKTDIKRVKENKKRMQKAQIKEGILFGCKVFFSVLAGVVLAQSILEGQNVRMYAVPTFAVVCMWAACTGSVFCAAGLLRNLFCLAFRK